MVFAVANRQLVTLSFDPFNTTDPALAVRMPLFVLMIAVAMLGVVGGRPRRPGSASGIGGSARQHEAERRQERAKLAELRAARRSRAIRSASGT